MTRRIESRLLLAALALVAAGRMLAASAHDLVSQGNQALEDKKFDEALSAYEQAAKEAPQAPEVYFNQGAALYQKGEFQKAADAFEQSALRSQEPGLEARSKFNQGNSAFRGAVGQLQSDPQQALDGVGRSVKLYQDALKLDPQLDDARYNVEVARRTMKRILEEMKKQPPQGRQNQKQQQGQQQDDPQQQLQQLLQKQQQATQQSEQLSRQQQRQGKSQDTSQQSQQLASEQQQIKDQTQQLADQLKQSGKPEQQKAAGHLEQASGEQNQAERELGRNQPSGAAPRQQEAENEIEKAMASLKGEKPPEPKQNQQQQQHEQAARKNAQKLREKQSKDAQQNARDILNQERANRRQRDLAIMGRTRPVDKDW